MLRFHLQLSQVRTTRDSGQLVAHFESVEQFLSLDDAGNVLEWQASNNRAITLRGGGSPVSNIRFEPEELASYGALVVEDFSRNNRYLSGSLGDVRLPDATIYWLGYYDPGRNGSLMDKAGQYLYSFGRDGSAGSQMNHQIDGGNFELYGGSGTQTGPNISYLNGHYSVWKTEYFKAPTDIGHRAFVNGIDLNVPSDSSGYNAGGSEPGQADLFLFGWQDSQGASGGYNFVGNLSELIIYDGILTTEDSTLIESYLNDKLTSRPPPPPLLDGQTTMFVDISGRTNDLVPGFVPHGDPQLEGTAKFVFDSIKNTMDFDIRLESDRYQVTQAHFYNINKKPNGDSIFCWGGRWSDHDFLSGNDFAISASNIQDILNNPQDWMLIIHTEGGHFALDEDGDLIPYSGSPDQETSVTDQLESGTRFNSRVGRMLTNRRLREMNPNSSGFSDAAFRAVYPDESHFDRVNMSPFADANGNAWIESDSMGGWRPSEHGAARGLSQSDIDNNFYLFYRYDDQGPSWDFGGPEGAGGGFLRQLPLLTGDFDNDGRLAVNDIDLLNSALRESNGSVLFDLDDNRQTNGNDQRIWVEQLANTFYGDANLDGEFNSSDFISVFQLGEYEDDIVANSTWATGDWNGDGEFDTSDFILAFQSGSYELGPRTSAEVVPEMSSSSLLFLAMLMLTAMNARHFHPLKNMQ